MSALPVDIAQVRDAARRIGAFIHRTPVLTSSALDESLGARVFLKCENFQKAGVFKSRGAFNAVYSLDDEVARRGVVTSSSGNQAAALSLAARSRGIHAWIAMPRNALAPKVAAVRRYGGEIVWVRSAGAVPTAEEYDATAAEIAARTGASPVHPFNDVRTIAGQGTCALELLDDLPQLDLVLAPVGGGGLLSGTCVAVKGGSPRTAVIGCEPEMADDAARSLRAGEFVPQTDPRTIADGLRTSLGSITYPIIRSLVDDIVTVSEESIVRAMRLVWEVAKIVIEPSASVPIAALLERKLPDRYRSVGVIVSGGNVDLESLPWIPRVG